MDITTDNKNQSIREVQESSTSGVVLSKDKKNLPFEFHETDLSKTGGNVVINTDLTEKENDLDSEEIPKKDKDRFYKKTLKSDII